MKPSDRANVGRTFRTTQDSNSTNRLVLCHCLCQVGGLLKVDCQLMGARTSRSSVGLLDLPDVILRNVIRLCVKERKDCLSMIRTCWRMRNLALDAISRLPEMTHFKLELRYRREPRATYEDYPRRYDEFIKLVNMNGCWVQSVHMDIQGSVFLGRDTLRSPLPQLKHLLMHGKPTILNQFVQVAQNVQELDLVVMDVSAEIMEWMRRLPLKTLKLSVCSYNVKIKRTISGEFLSSSLEVVEIVGYPDTGVSISAESIFSMLYRSRQTLSRFVIMFLSVMDDGDFEFFDLNDCQCKFMTISLAECSPVFLSKMCHRNLQHLHLSLSEGQTAVGETLFRNGSFSLRNVMLRFSEDQDVSSVIRALISRNPNLEILHILGPGRLSEVLAAGGSSSSPIQGLAFLRVFLLSNFSVNEPAAWLRWFSVDNHPHLQVFGWRVRRYMDITSAVEAVKEAGRRMATCGSVFRVVYMDSEHCSHSDFREMYNHCEQCRQAVDSAGCCAEGQDYCH